MLDEIERLVGGAGFNRRAGPDFPVGHRVHAGHCLREHPFLTFAEGPVCTGNERPRVCHQKREEAGHVGDLHNR